MHILLSPPIAFTAMLFLAWGLMWFAKLLAPAGKPVGGKYAHYACGEDVEMKPLQPNYSKFYAVAFAYSILHVAALMLLSIPFGHAALYGVIFLGIVSIAVLSLISELKLV